LKYRVEAARFFSLCADTPTPEGGLAAIETRLRELPQPIDVVILGMGEDGHTASLFPCAVESQVALSTNNISTVAAINPTTAPYARISLTLAAIAKAQAVFLHITGAKKRGVYEQALSEGKLPIAKVLNAATGTRRVYWAA